MPTVLVPCEIRFRNVYKGIYIYGKALVCTTAAAVLAQSFHERVDSTPPQPCQLPCTRAPQQQCRPIVATQVQECANENEQCGGAYWTGATCCVTGMSCKTYNRVSEKTGCLKLNLNIDIRVFPLSLFLRELT